MRLSNEYRSRKTPNVGKMASKDQSRPILTHLHLDVDRKMIEATDSYGLVSIPVEVEEGDVSGMVPIEAWTAFFKAHSKRVPSPSLQCGEDCVLEIDGSTSRWKRPEGTFPSVAQLMPDEANRSGFRVRLSVPLLANIAAGLGTDEVTLGFVRSKPELDESAEGVGYFPSNLRPIIVSNGEHGEQAILMPVRMMG